MSILKTVSPDKAEGKLKGLYGAVEKVFGMVPNNARVLGINEHALESQLMMIGYYSQHEKISSNVFAMIRLLVARDCGNDYCTKMNTGFLMQAGIEAEALQSVDADNLPGIFSEEEKALLKYTVKAVKTPAETGAEDIRALKDAGWREIDIFDAVEHGARMVYSSHIFNAFKIEIDI